MSSKIHSRHVQNCAHYNRSYGEQGRTILPSHGFHVTAKVVRKGLIYSYLSRSGSIPGRAGATPLASSRRVAHPHQLKTRSGSEHGTNPNDPTGKHKS